MSNLNAAQRYKEAVTQAVREARGIKSQTQFLANRCKQDAAILWHLFETYFEDRVRADLETVRSKSSSTVVPMDVSEAGRVLRKQQHGPSPAALSNAIAAGTSRMKMYTFLINGKPMREVSITEARQWLLSHSRDNRFVELALSGLPQRSDRTFAQFYRDDEVEKLYQQAERERKEAA